MKKNLNASLTRLVGSQNLIAFGFTGTPLYREEQEQLRGVEDSKQTAPSTPTRDAKIRADILERVIVYTDGSCLGNPGPGGWAIIMKSGEVETIQTGGEADTTNNRMELMGPLIALSSIEAAVPMIIRSDSKYVIDGMNRWVEGWIKKGWRGANGKPIKNPDLWKQLVEAARGHTITWEWVEGHANDDMNIRCDGLAQDTAELAGGRRAVTTS